MDQNQMDIRLLLPEYYFKDLFCDFDRFLKKKHNLSPFLFYKFILLSFNLTKTQLLAFGHSNDEFRIMSFYQTRLMFILHYYHNPHPSTYERFVESKKIVDNYVMFGASSYAKNHKKSYEIYFNKVPYELSNVFDKDGGMYLNLMSFKDGFRIAFERGNIPKVVFSYYYFKLNVLLNFLSDSLPNKSEQKIFKNFLGELEEYVSPFMINYTH